MLLLDPLTIGRGAGRVAPSRVLFGPHETNLARPGTRAIGDRHVAYYERRAAGGAGVIVVEEASVHASDWPYERAPLAAKCQDGWAAVAAAVHRHGALALAAIGHSGGQGASVFHQLPLWAPSPVPEVASREVPKVMEADDIGAVVAGFADAVGRARAAGLDGVEVNAGQFSLVRQFLSGLTNQRGDEYGTEKIRFAREVLTAVRAALGEDLILALRLSVDEMAPWAGIVPDAGAAIAVELAPLLDAIICVRGSIFTAWATRPDGHEPPGFAIDLARTVRDALHAAGADQVRVFAEGSVVDPGQAAWALDSAAADGVEMTRAQLADADLVAKLRAGAPEQIRPCILCNQTCKVRDNRNPIVSCVVDPRSGHETTDPAEAGPGAATGRGSASRIRPLTVVGAGVAGLECARTAAQRGMMVTVLEASERTGGTLRTAAHGAGRDRLAAIADWLDAECRRLGVTIETGRRVTPEDLAALRAAGDVVLATGGRDRPVPFAVAAGAVVRSATDHLADPVLPEGPVVVWDPLGGPIAVSVAEGLAARGAPVTLVTPDLLVGEKLSLTGDLAPAQVRLHGAGVGLVKRAQLREVRPDAVVVEDRFSGERTTLPAVAVVDCGHRLPDATFGADDAEPTPASRAAEGLARIGDATAPRTVYEAILEGRRAGAARR